MSKTSKALQFLRTATYAQNIWNLGINLKEEYDKRVFYTYKIQQSRGDIFLDAATWVIENINVSAIKNYDVQLRGENSERFVGLVPQPERRVPFILNGAKIYYSFSSSKDDNIINNYGHIISNPSSEIVFSSPTKSGAREIERLLSQLAKKQANLKVYGYDYGWTALVDLPYRSFDSLVISDNYTQRIQEDIELFLNSKDKYDLLGAPYKRNYLFYGPPGTGKSSLAYAIANNLNRDIYIVNLHSVDKDDKLVSMPSGMKKNPVILIEDVDTVSSSHIREDQKNDTTINLSTLLSFLDGSTLPEGAIVILTSNRPQVLDNALLRSGRMDLKVLLNYLNKEETEELTWKLTGQKIELNVVKEICPADIVELIKRNLSDQDRAIKEIKAYVEDPRPLDGLESFEELKH